GTGGASEQAAGRSRVAEVPGCSSRRCTRRGSGYERRAISRWGDIDAEGSCWGQAPLELGDEGPGLTRDPALALALILLRGIVIPAVRTPAHGMPFRATFVRSAYVRAA